MSISFRPSPADTASTDSPAHVGSTPLRSRMATRELVYAALIAGLLAASAWIALPVGAVPVTFQTMLVMIAALVLRPRAAAAALAVYLSLGVAGLPVFSGGQGGLGVIAGPTGGYLVGFLVAAVAGALVRVLLQRLRLHAAVADAACCATVLVLTYGIGTVRLAAVLGLPLPAAVAAGVVPFVVPDIAKAIAAVMIARGVRRANVL